MPFGESMIGTLKSYTSIMLNQSKRFRKTIGGNNKQRQSTGNLPNAIPQQLKEIRERIKREKKRQIRERLWFTSARLEHCGFPM